MTIHRLGGLVRRLGGLAGGARRSSVGHGGAPFQAPIPSWVPATPGDVASYSGGGAVLTNNWRATHDPTAIGYDVFDSKKINQAYSGMCLIPGWRTHGGLLAWGGGHSATNYNGVHILTLAADTMYFECVATPYDWTAALDRGDNLSEINTYGEATGSSPLRLGGPHSYGSGDGIGSDFVQVYNQAYGYVNTGQGAQAAHRLDLSNPGAAASSRAFERLTSTLGTLSGMASPTLTRYVPSQNRIYFMRSSSTGSLSWFDRSSLTFVQGTGADFAYDSSDTDGGDRKNGALVHVPSRNLLLGCCREGGNLQIQWADTTASQPAASSPVTLSAAIGVPAAGGAQAVSWCSHSNKLLVFGADDATRVYEITIPGSLGDTWTVDSHITNITLTPQVLGTWGKTCDYIESCRCILVPGAFADTGNDTVQVYRPRGT